MKKIAVILLLSMCIILSGCEDIKGTPIKRGDITNSLMPRTSIKKAKEIVLNGITYRFEKFDVPVGIKVSDILVEEVKILERDLVKVTYEIDNLTPHEQLISGLPFIGPSSDLYLTSDITLLDGQSIQFIRPSAPWDTDVDYFNFTEHLRNSGIGGIAFETQYLHGEGTASLHFYMPKKDTDRYILETCLFV